MSKSLRFGRFELHTVERQLYVDGQAAALGARAFDVLLALAERHPRVVSQAELFDLAWPGLVVEPNNLTVQISTLRRVMGHAAIATVTGRGYRLAVTPEPAGGGPEPERPPPEPRIVRRLAAIVAADVVGWARLVQRDAEAAVLAWREVRTAVVERSVADAGGRLIELTPERMLVEFGSAVDALAWALELQRRLAERRASAAGSALRMRIGMCVDDVIVDDGKLVGDGVAVAGEVHHCAGHDEVLVTANVRDITLHRLAAQFEPLGERLLQRLQRPVTLFRALAATVPAAAAAARHASDERLASLAVLPFASEGPEADPYFGQGVTEEIIASLSLNRALFVIAHTSTLRYRDSSADLATIAAELGVRYLVSGRVRRAGQRLRIGVSLVLAADQRVIWQERFDGDDDDVFGFQARIAEKVAAAIDPEVQKAEIARVRGRPTDSFGAYDCVLRAMVGLYRFDTPEFDAAGTLLRRAVELDADYAQAHTYLGWWYSLRAGEGRSAVRGEEARLALAHAERAVQLDGRDAWALSVAGHLQALFRRQLVPAMESFGRALALNPSCAAAWARSAITLVYLGQPEEAIARVRNAMELSPFDPSQFSYFTTLGNANLVAGRADEAVAWLSQALRLNPRYNAARRLLVAALVMSGELDEARATAQEFLAAVPDFSVAEFGDWYPLDPKHLEPMLHAMRRAGLPA